MITDQASHPTLSDIASLTKPPYENTFIISEESKFYEMKSEFTMDEAVYI